MGCKIPFAVYGVCPYCNKEIKLNEQKDAESFTHTEVHNHIQKDHPKEYDKAQADGFIPWTREIIKD